MTPTTNWQVKIYLQNTNTTIDCVLSEMEVEYLEQAFFPVDGEPNEVIHVSNTVEGETTYIKIRASSVSALEMKPIRE
ncbi:MAG TPA: hypothetical protein V6C65_24615 [Allocoleopsis sp.]